MKSARHPCCNPREARGPKHGGKKLHSFSHTPVPANTDSQHALTHYTEALSSALTATRRLFQRSSAFTVTPSAHLRHFSASLGDKNPRKFTGFAHIVTYIRSVVGYVPLTPEETETLTAHGPSRARSHALAYSTAFNTARAVREHWSIRH